MKPRAPLLALLLLLPATPLAAATAMRVEPPAGATHLRFAVPEALYAAGLTSDFAALLVLDAQGRRLDYAACPRVREHEAIRPAPVLGVPFTARAELADDGGWRLSRPAGGRADISVEIDEWVLDLRAADGQTAGVNGVPAVRELRSSPNLQQWSNRIAFQQEGETLSFAPQRMNFLRLKLEKPAIAVPGELPVRVQNPDWQREPAWFEPQPQSDGVFRHTRRLAVFAARLADSRPDIGWSLESRQARWDAWKPRGQIGDGASDRVLRFSAVSDPLWRVTGPEDAQLELAHAAHEIRIPSLAGVDELTLQYTPGERSRPVLSCRDTENLTPLAPRRISAETQTGDNGDTGPGNVRGYFLLIAGVVLLIGGLLRYWLKSRR